ncbi:heme-copper oxidase subunit III [Sphingobacterium sp. T2]|uniref:cytochrome c oxidase subunit 3 n=1 Tax=Sphingobacterium sp. T2 TaxID=1590596 RepID=UPI000B177966|nr:heme-copper oxidase subunit III [Sphingobacterium sp. T2]
MEVNDIKLEELRKQRKAKKFNLWLGMIGMFMMFAALSSGFIVYTASGVDKGIKTILPQTFVYSTIVIILSSVTLHMAFKAAKVNNLAKQKLLLLATIVLGIVFFVLQVQAWGILTSQGVYFINNNASSVFYLYFYGLALSAHYCRNIGAVACLCRCGEAYSTRQ